jgi:DNA modification methylase
MSYKLINGDCLNILKTLSDKSINCCVTSPPYYGLRDYGVAGQVGLEDTPDEYVNKLVEIFREVRRVLRDDGTLWMNLGDSYCANATGSQGDGKSTIAGGLKNQIEAGKRPNKKGDGLKPKDLIGIPWMVAFALRADGWYLRSDIIWSKPNPMPESVQDRPTKAHEYIFLLSKSQSYYYDNEAIAEAAIYAGDDRGSRTDNRRGTMCNSMSGVTGFTRNKRTVWTVTTKPYAEAHFATYPPDLIQPCVLAGCPEGGTVLDPFNGSGTTGQVALQNGRKYIGIELNSEYIELTKRRLSKVTQQPSLFTAQPTQWEPVAMFGDD